MQALGNKGVEVTMLKRVLRKLNYAMLLLKMAGPRVFFQQLKRHLYTRESYVLLEKNLEQEKPTVECKIEYSLGLATEQDMDDVLAKAKTESKEEVQDLLFQKWMYDCGFHNCYVARTAGTNEMCFLLWVISPEDNNLVDRELRGWFPKLKDNECVVEAAYTFEKYRGNRLQASVNADLGELYKRKGFKRMLCYIRTDNVASVKGCERGGYRKCKEVPKLKLLFSTRMKHT